MVEEGRAAVARSSSRLFLFFFFFFFVLWFGLGVLSAASFHSVSCLAKQRR